MDYEFKLKVEEAFRKICIDMNSTKSSLVFLNEENKRLDDELKSLSMSGLTRKQKKHIEEITERLREFTVKAINLNGLDIFNHNIGVIYESLAEIRKKLNLSQQQPLKSWKRLGLIDKKKEEDDFPLEKY